MRAGLLMLYLYHGGQGNGLGLPTHKAQNNGELFTVTKYLGKTTERRKCLLCS